MYEKSTRVIKLFQTKDTAAKTVIGPIIRAYHNAAAVRIFTDGLKDRNTLGAHPEDYELIELGIQDEENGEIQGYDGGPVTIVTGKQWLTLQNADRTVTQEHD